MKKNTVSQSTSVAALCLATLVSGCVAPPPPPPRYVVVRPPPVYVSPLPPAVVAYSSPVVTPVISVYVDPPMVQPEPIAVSWAPPAMLVEVPPLSPFPLAVWTGGYWDWHGRWVWAAGRWMAPPQLGYGWVQPYYEHRDNAVLFVSGYWSAPGLRFIPPPLGISIAFAALGVGVVAGLAPIGPQGVFVPPPPGSRPGLIVPAPIGTPPAVVTSAPPVTNVGMRIQNTTITNNVTNNVTNTTNVTNIANTRNFTVTAPAGVTASGKPFEAAVPAAAHLAAALPPVMRLEAPVPVSTKPVAAFMSGRSPVALPAAQVVRSAPSIGTLSAPSAPSAASVQRPEPEHRQAALSPAASPEAPRTSRVSDERIEAARQSNVQQAAQHAQRPPDRFAGHAQPPQRQAIRPSTGSHPGERPKPEHKKE